MTTSARTGKNKVRGSAGTDCLRSGTRKNARLISAYRILAVCRLVAYKIIRTRTSALIVSRRNTINGRNRGAIRRSRTAHCPICGITVFVCNSNRTSTVFDGNQCIGLTPTGEARPSINFLAITFDRNTGSIIGAGMRSLSRTVTSRIGPHPLRVKMAERTRDSRVEIVLLGNSGKLGRAIRLAAGHACHRIFVLPAKSVGNNSKLHVM